MLGFCMLASEDQHPRERARIVKVLGSISIGWRSEIQGVAFRVGLGSRV